MAFPGLLLLAVNAAFRRRCNATALVVVLAASIRIVVVVADVVVVVVVLESTEQEETVGQMPLRRCARLGNKTPPHLCNCCCCRCFSLKAGRDFLRSLVLNIQAEIIHKRP